MTKDEVVTTLEKAGIVIKSTIRLPNDSGYQIRGLQGEIINIYDTGKLVVQGKNQPHITEVLGLGSGQSHTGPSQVTGWSETVNPHVFVAYGHDMAARNELEAMLRRWALSPVILDQLPSAGATLIEKLEAYIDVNEVGFGVVLATPDDKGYAKHNESAIMPRARQNVILELGMLLKTLGRERVAIFRPPKAEMESPSDIDGLIYLEFQDKISEKKTELAKEIESAIPGFSVPASKI